MMPTALTPLHALHDYIPSPSDGVWRLGPVPVRGYALCIIIGIFAAAVLADRRYRARGGALGAMNEIADVGGAVRARRRPALPRHHRLVGLFRQARQPDSLAGGLEGRSRHSRGGRARRPRCLHRLPSARRVDAADRRRRRPRSRAGTGHWPLGKLVQPRAVRSADLVAVVGPDRRCTSSAA